jgi:hypothetical protein
MQAGPTTMQRLNTARMKGSAWPLFGQLFIFYVTYMAMNFFW